MSVNVGQQANFKFEPSHQQWNSLRAIVLFLGFFLHFPFYTWHDDMFENNVQYCVGMCLIILLIKIRKIWKSIFFLFIWCVRFVRGIERTTTGKKIKNQMATTKATEWFFFGLDSDQRSKNGNFFSLCNVGAIEREGHNHRQWAQHTGRKESNNRKQVKYTRSLTNKGHKCEHFIESIFSVDLLVQFFFFFILVLVFLFVLIPLTLFLAL